MNIIVLGGGLSTERDVSLASSGQIANALTRKGHQALVLDSYAPLPIFANFNELYQSLKKPDYSHKIPPTEPDLEALRAATKTPNALLGENLLEACKLADIIFIGLHGGIGENGQLQAVFDVFGIKYTGSGYAGSLLAMDKLLSKQQMLAANIPTADFEIIEGNETPKMPLPFVIKPCNGGSSVGVTVVKNAQDLAPALAYARKYENKLLIEKFVAGREFSVGVLNGNALPPIEIIPDTSSAFFDYSSKYQGTSSEICPANITPAQDESMRKFALAAHNALGLKTYSRTDFIMDANGNFFCLESNSLPGMTPASLLPQEAAAIGIAYDDLCEIIALDN